MRHFEICLWGSLLRYVSKLSLVNSKLHMGRSEAPLPSDSNGEESLEEPTENIHCVLVDDLFTEGDYECVFRLRGLRGVDSKYNEQDSCLATATQFRLLSLQTKT